MATSAIELLKDFPRHLKRVREKAGWTQQQLAGKTGISRAFIAMIESRRRLPSLAILEKILEVTTVELGERAWDLPEEPCAGQKTRSPIVMRHTPPRGSSPECAVDGQQEQQEQGSAHSPVA